ncbi:MAG: hypothetical protein HZA46_16945 [Planctomycetales bacterium]|nr:hypothetical protein [Planctomycetales bacterium]
MEGVLCESSHVVGIVLLSVVAAVMYGIVHDQITARVCVEYFTIFHPPVFATDDPTLLGIGWGIIATWWVGFILGVPLALCARLGSQPRRDIGSLVRPIGKLLAIMATCALAAGLTGWLLAESGAIRLLGRMAIAVPPERHARFLADLWAHNASYAVGFFGGIVLCFRVRLRRR